MNMLRGRLGGVKWALLGVVGVAAVGYAGYRILFARTGEAAVNLLPSDASCVVTLDSHPSEGQLAAFTKLVNALKREGVDSDIEQGVNDIIGKAGLAKEVRQYLTNNMATAWWQAKEGQTQHMVALFSITNPGAVSGILATGTKVEGAGVPAYTFGKADAVSAVVGEYLAVSSDAATIKRIEETRTGAPSMGSLSEYRTARAALPSDANVMVFVSPSSLSGVMGRKDLNTSMWMSFGASIRDGGIQFDYRGPVDAKSVPALGDLSQMAPLGRDLLKKLPPDAYGLLAYSSMDKMMAAARGSAERFSDKESIVKEQDKFEKETGISIDNDVLPAFKGDVAFAVYPDANGSDKSADGLLLIDNANGANPAALADKVRALIERKSAEQAAQTGRPAIHFVEKKIGQVTVWSLDEASAQEFRKSLGSKSGPEGSTTPDPMFGNKNISFATANGSVVVASSDAMMTKALLVFNGDRSLADDPAFAQMETLVGEKDQFLIMCSLSRIAERFRSSWSESMKDSEFTPDDLIALFGGPNAGLVGSCHIENNSVTGTLFLPLDFDRMAKLIRVMKSKGKGETVPALSDTRTDSSSFETR